MFIIDLFELLNSVLVILVRFLSFDFLNCDVGHQRNF